MNSNSQNSNHSSQPNNSQNTSQEEPNSWMNNPKLAGMDKSKLEMLQNMANQGSQKSQSDLLPFLMAAASQSRAKGMNFQPNEIDTIIEVLKMGKSPGEVAQLDKIISLMRMMRK